MKSSWKQPPPTDLYNVRSYHSASYKILTCEFRLLQVVKNNSLSSEREDWNLYFNGNPTPAAAFRMERSHMGCPDKDNASSYGRACCGGRLKTPLWFEWSSGKPGSSPGVNIIIPPDPCWSDKSIMQALAGGQRDNSV